MHYFLALDSGRKQKQNPGPTLSNKRLGMRKTASHVIKNWSIFYREKNILNLMQPTIIEQPQP